MLSRLSSVAAAADRALSFIERVSVFALFVISCGVLVWDIALRAIFGGSLAWAAELTRYAIVWLVFIGSSIAARRGAHISIDLFSEILSERASTRLIRLASFISTAGCLILCWQSWSLVDRMMGFSQMSPSLRWPMWTIYLAMPVGFALMSLRFLQFGLSVSLDDRKRAIAEAS